MGTTKLENNHMKKYMEFVLSNFVIIAFVVLFIASCFLTPAFLTVNKYQVGINSEFHLCDLCNWNVTDYYHRWNRSVYWKLCLYYCMFNCRVNPEKLWRCCYIDCIGSCARNWCHFRNNGCNIEHCTFHSNIGDDNYIKRCSIYVPDGSEQTYRWNIPS